MSAAASPSCMPAASSRSAARPTSSAPARIPIRAGLVDSLPRLGSRAALGRTPAAGDRRRGAGDRGFPGRLPLQSALRAGDRHLPDRPSRRSTLLGAGGLVRCHHHGMNAARRPGDDVILSVEDLAVHFPVGGGLLGGGRAAAACGRRRRSRTEARRMPRPRRRIRLRQVDGRAFDPRPAGADARHASCSTGRSSTDRQSVDRKALARIVQMVFQDPYASLNPRQTVRRTLEDPLRLHGVTAQKRDRRTASPTMLGACRPAARARRPLSA